MTQELLEQCKAAGLTQAEIDTLAEFYALRSAIEEGGRGEKSAVLIQQTKTAIDNRGSESVFTEILNLSHALFGGFTPSQVRRLLAVCKYHNIPLESLKALMFELRRQSWARGWVRTRDSIERMAKAA